MTLTYHRAHSKPNASLISMFQRFSDIFIIFAGLYIVMIINNNEVDYLYFVIALIALVFFQMIGGITDFYRSWRGVKLSSEIKLILKNWSISFLLTVGVIYFFSRVLISGHVFLEWFMLTSVGVVFSRSAIRYCTGLIRRWGYNTRNVAIAGTQETGLSLLRSFRQEAWLGFNVVGIYDDDLVSTEVDLNYVGTLKDLVSDAKDGKLDRIYLAMKMSEDKKIKKLVMELTDTTCSVSLIPDVFTLNVLQSRAEEINGVTVVPLFDTPLNGINRVFKRLEDLILSLFILLIISPVLLAVACAVKFTSKGPIIFKQTRYGMDGKAIKVWKFRSMSVMENDDKVIQATKNDIRVTKVGRFLRKTSLDELPQFINVLSGTMSIVGPRPHAVAHNEEYRKLIKGYMLRHKVKPGITGLAQISGCRGETDTLDKMERRIEYDLEYIRSWSIALDIKIVILTVFKGFVSKTAY
ncbi:undecaprenyl-phosphate glucose phosphotransferase [Raoultella planticola]|uniref:Undecaprenyl-phosphate glucose phosphotransferase n=1 Tax=Klebsiella sp. 2212/52 TaxID=1497829 RepID=A0A0P0YS58_9ENTR|nr:undecaprenyl-phosphate glucose phosphotransferase [Raoultella planticola]EIY2678217.1 undecaprenyl-phosphate glucose phosphotransferase [Raoultella planticola]BAT24110.1 undecaprenyl-phosphate glucose phosphotransferase [Klebsiella sp. 2212/52]VTM98064.1 Putative colanic biosynthesis UDP-glucose lipid carrier transferase [Raoultella planticola]